jgi:hypothetical protein
MAIGLKRRLEALIGKNSIPVYVSWKDLESVNIFNLREERVPVSPTVYIQIVNSKKEYALRKEAVKEYFGQPDVIFYSNGTIHAGSREIITLNIHASQKNK